LIGHEDFGEYLQDLADAIISYNPNISPYEAMALAKAGIVDPAGITQFEKNINMNFKNSTYGTDCDNNP